MYEAQVHEELSQLVGDSGALHKFLEAALRLESHAFESALGPVSPSLVHLTEGSPSLLVSPPPPSPPLVPLAQIPAGRLVKEVVIECIIVRWAGH